MRLIDGDALTKRLVEFCNKNCPYTAKVRNVMCGSCFMGLALEAVEDAPTIEPERKRGKWIPENRTMDAFWVCSSCGFPSEAHAANILYKYCPNCGAKMEEGRQE